MWRPSKRHGPEWKAQGRGREENLFVESSLSHREKKINSILCGRSFTKPRRIALAPFAARLMKQRLIRRYCEAKISATAVTRAFEIFPELRSA
jgi:hypothetical protein